MSIRLRDELYNAIKKQLDIEDLELKVGIKDSVKYANGKEVHKVASDNEYGHTTDFGVIVPPRPFMRITVAEKEERWHRLFGHLVGTERSVARAMGKLGTRVQGDIQKTIANLKEPANTPYTIEMKGSSNPLVDSGLMRKSVSYTVQKAGK